MSTEAKITSALGMAGRALRRDVYWITDWPGLYLSASVEPVRETGKRRGRRRKAQRAKALG